MSDAKRAFTVDVAGLFEALTEQFPEPLLCVRELVQNAADAESSRIEVDVAYDASRRLMRISVRDDGRGMNEDEVQGYLTIGFSQKDASRHRGRFGMGKLSPYALRIVRMTVETSDGHETHRLTFQSDGSGTMARLGPRPRGTVVWVYKETTREEAEDIAERIFTLVSDNCGSLAIPLFVNGTQVNRDVALPSHYSVSFSAPAGTGVLGVTLEPTHVLMGGGIVLETDAPLLGAEVSYILDSPRLAPTLSRNAVRRDQAFDALLRAARQEMPNLTARVARELRVRTDRLRQEGTPVERGLEAQDRPALEWLRLLLLESEDEVPDPVVRDAPVLETADGDLVSANEVVEVIRREGRVPISRVPRPRDEISAYADRGVPVLLLYRDLEDFLERQSIETLEIDGLDDGIEVSQGAWGKGEKALATPLPKTSRPTVFAPAFLGAAAAVAVLVCFFVWGPSSPQSSMPGVPVVAQTVPRAVQPERSWQAELSEGTASAHVVALPVPSGQGNGFCGDAGGDCGGLVGRAGLGHDLCDPVAAPSFDGELAEGRGRRPVDGRRNQAQAFQCFEPGAFASHRLFGCAGLVLARGGRETAGAPRKNPGLSRVGARGSDSLRRATGSRPRPHRLCRFGFSGW